MNESLPETTASRPHVSSSGIETFQTVLTGLILAFIFRAFLVEPFIIPTGSMAPSLLGAHATQVCPACGWEFDFAPLRTAAVQGEFVCPPRIVCPNCQLRIEPKPERTNPKSGDRILVHKWPSAWNTIFPPRRWSVIVFRDPGDPDQHYIKRLVGLPGESIEIVDGDLYIDGVIARKPAWLQESLWQVVFDQDYIPRFAGQSGQTPPLRWAPTQPPPRGQQGWHGLDTRVIRYAGLDNHARQLAFNRDAGREYLLDFYAYNRSSSGQFVGDVRLAGVVTIEDGQGTCTWEIIRSPNRFRLQIGADGELRLTMGQRDSEQAILIGVYRSARLANGRPVRIELAHVDRRVWVGLDGKTVIESSDVQYPTDLPAIRDAGARGPIGLHLIATNLRCSIAGLRVERDIHYTAPIQQTRRALPGRPFKLKAAEYFVLGDNSPDSHDSREWATVGPHLPVDTRPGTVRADQIVGEAAFVYLPGLMALDAFGHWSMVDLGRVRFVR